MNFSPISYKITPELDKQTGIFELDFTEEFLNHGIVPLEPSDIPFEPITNRISGETKRKVYNIRENESPTGRFFHDYINQELITKLISSSEATVRFFNQKWPLNCTSEPDCIPRFIKGNISVTNQLILDTEYVKMSPHIDNRFAFGILILNLKDNTNSTAFYKRYQEHGEPFYYAPTEFGKGIFFLNSENSTHSIHNTANNRIISLTTCQIMLKNHR